MLKLASPFRLVLHPLSFIVVFILVNQQPLAMKHIIPEGPQIEHVVFEDHAAFAADSSIFAHPPKKQAA